MKVHLIKKITIQTYVDKHVNANQGFDIWLKMIKTADWKVPNDIPKSIPGADIIGRGTKRVIFNIGGNKFRCICTYSFGKSHVHLFINWIGTHAEYSKLIKSNLHFTVSKY